MHDGLGGVETLRAARGAVHDTMAAVELHGVVQPRQARVGHLIAGVDNPSVGLLENSRAKVVLGVPPVGRTGCGTASAEDALVETVQQLTIAPRLVVLGGFVTLGAVSALQPRLDT